MATKMGQNRAPWLAPAKRLRFFLLGLALLALAAGLGMLGIIRASASNPELLQNGGFEQLTSGWQTRGGTFTVVSSSAAPGLVRSGSYAAALASTDSTTKWLYQRVPVVPGGSYTFGGGAIKNDADISSVYLRISWYSSQDGTGSEIRHDDSTWLSHDSSAYRDLTVTATAPSQALSARVKCVLVPASANSVTAYFDDLSFTGPKPTLAKVIEVIDGDTIRLESGQKVRYIGIDAPEQGEPWYDEATNKNRELVLGKRVRLERDVSETDPYGRLLRYLYVEGSFVNARLVELGYARATPFSPDTKYQALFSQLEAKARDAGLGIWALDHVVVTPSSIALDIGGREQFSATAYDQYDNVISGVTFTWSVAAGGGSIDSAGLFTAGTAAGMFSDTVRAEATQGAITRSGTATVTVNPWPEQIPQQREEGTPASGRGLLALVLAPVLAFIGLGCILLAFWLRRRR